jgi:quercetin dioxygenase-like cupin family protein
MRNLNQAVIIAGVAATVALATYAYAQKPPANVVTVYYTTPLENDPTRVVRLQSVAIPAGGGNSYHRHPGDQWAAIQEGEVTLTIKGQPPRVLKAGESVYIPRGTIHRNQNLTDKPARSIELNIVDKDKPLVEPVPD